MPEKGKKSLPILETTHTQIAHESIDTGKSMSDLIAEAWQLYEERGSGGPSETAGEYSRVPPRYRGLLDKVADILCSGDEKTISPMRSNIVFFHQHYRRPGHDRT